MHTTFVSQYKICDLSFMQLMLTYARIVSIVISSSEMLKPHWLKLSHVTNAYCFFYAPTGAIMNVNGAFFHVILNSRFLRLNSGIK